jgi:hypothetical protein
MMRGDVFAIIPVIVIITYELGGKTALIDSKHTLQCAIWA